MIDAAYFAKIKDGACLVSCGSGSVIDGADLAETIKSGKLGGAALDTCEWEPIKVEIDLEKRGKRHIEWMDSLGVLDSSVQLVHGVWLNDKELDTIAKHSAIVVHCPVSNMYLASGVARIPEMLQKGINRCPGRRWPRQ